MDMQQEMQITVRSSTEEKRMYFSCAEVGAKVSDRYFFYDLIPEHAQV